MISLNTHRSLLDSLPLVSLDRSLSSMERSLSSRDRSSLFSDFSLSAPLNTLGGVGNDGGVRCKRLHSGWEGNPVKLSRLPNREDPSPPKGAAPGNPPMPPNGPGRVNGGPPRKPAPGAPLSKGLRAAARSKIYYHTTITAK